MRLSLRITICAQLCFQISSFVVLSSSHKESLMQKPSKQSPAYSTPEMLQVYATLQELSSLLLARQFIAFWSKVGRYVKVSLALAIDACLFNSQLPTAMQSEPTLTKAYEAIPNFTTLLRQRIAEEVIRPLFRSITVDRFRSWLGIQSTEDISAIVSSLGDGWSVQGDTVQVPALPVAAAVVGEDQPALATGGKDVPLGMDSQSSFQAVFRLREC